MTPDAVKTKVFSYTPDGKPISKENIKKLSKKEQAKVVKKPVNYIKRRAEDQVFAVVDTGRRCRLPVMLCLQKEV